MDKKGFVIIKGTNNILLSAPHSTKHKRKDSIRGSETKTGVLAKNVATKTKSFCIYKNVPELNDANWDKNSKYKNAILDLIKKYNINILLDIHGMASHRKQDICIGINAGKNIQDRFDIVRKIVRIFKNYGFNDIGIDDPFGATNPNCISTYFAKKCNTITFQIEINKKYRSTIYKEFSKYKDLNNAFIEIVHILEKIV